MTAKKDARVRKWGMRFQDLFDELQVKKYRYDLGLKQRGKYES